MEPLWTSICSTSIPSMFLRDLWLVKSFFWERTFINREGSSRRAQERVQTWRKNVNIQILQIYTMSEVNYNNQSCCFYFVQWMQEGTLMPGGYMFPGWICTLFAKLQLSLKNRIHSQCIKPSTSLMGFVVWRWDLSCIINKYKCTYNHQPCRM